MSHAFDSPYQATIDTVRILCLFLAAVRVGLTAASWWKYTSSERILVVGVALTCIAFGETEWDHIGSGVGQGGRLWLHLGALILFLVWRPLGALWERHVVRHPVVAGER